MGRSDHPERGNNGRSDSSRNGHSSGREDAAGTVTWAPPSHDVEGANDDGIDLGQLAGVLWEGRRAIALIAVAVFAIAMLVTAASRMQFTSRGSLFLGDLQTQGGVFEALASELSPFRNGEKGAVGTEIEILKSRELITKAVLASGLNVQVRPANWEPPRYWKWRLGGRDLRSLAGSWGELRATATRLTDIASPARRFEVRFSSATEYDVFQGETKLGSGTLGKPFVATGVEMTLIAGAEAAIRANSRYSIKVNRLDETLEGVYESFRAQSPKPAPGSQINVIHLTYKNESPYQAQLFLEQLMSLYLIQNLEWKTAEASAAEAFLTKQLENIRKSFERAGQELADYKKDSATIALSEEAKAVIEQMATFEQQRIAARLQVAALEQVKKELAKGKPPTEAYLLGETQDTVLVTMSEALVKAELEYRRLSEQFTPDYPLVREAEAARDAQLKTVRSYVDSRLSRAREQVASLDSVIERFEGKLKTLPDAELRLASLTQQTEVYAKLYVFLLERQQQAALTKAATISKSRVLDQPTLPLKESSPKLRLNIPLGLALGLLLGFSFVLARWRFTTTFRTEAEIRKVFPSLPVFTSVPRMPVKRDRNGSGDRPLDALTADPRSGFVEALRLLRTNLYYSGSLQRDKVVLVSSSSPRDGKTMTTLCLAGILAADGKRVLVIDGDMRKPSHHILLRQPQQPGLSGILTGDVPWRDAVRAVQFPYGTIACITTGVIPPNPAELLSSAHLSKFLDEARNDFDFILIDSPPFPLVSDGLVFARHADRVFSVIRVGASDRRAAHEHVSRLSANRERYGIIINGISSGAGYGYGYYGDDDAGKRRRGWRRRRNEDTNQTLTT